MRVGRGAVGYVATVPTGDIRNRRADGAAVRWAVHPLDVEMPLLRIKLRPPPLQQGVVHRERLVDRLLASRRPRVVTITAPAGYGKTTLMAQWKEGETRPVAWLSLDRDDNDPSALLFHIVAALRDAGMARSTRFSGIRLTPDLVLPYGLARVASALESERACGVLMLDQVETIRSRASSDVVAELAVRLPPDMQLVVASRTGVRLPLVPLRARGALLELTAAELAMDRTEARALLENTGADVGDEDFDELLGRTEGWPAGLYLAGLAVASGSSKRSALKIGGTDRYLADYLRHEVLAHLSEARVSFLTRTAILERFCGSLCDAVRGATDSIRAIERMERSNLLIVPLDRTREWYRYHHLLRDFLQAELARREPALVPTLHTRAAEWFEAHHMPELAIAHAQAVGDTDRVARIVLRVGRVTYGLGRAETVFGWLRWFEHADRIGRYPDVAALGALVHALAGDEPGSDRWAAVLFAPRDGADKGELSYIGRLLRAILARDGTRQMRADAAAVREAPSQHEWLPSALGLEAFSYLWEGDVDRADALFAQAAAAGEWFLGLPAATLALACRAMIAIERGDWETGDELVDRSQRLIGEHGLDRYLTSGLSYAVTTRCAAHRGDLVRARRLLAEAATIRPLLTTATPGISVQTLLEMARAHSDLSDVAGARVVLREASDILAKRPDLGVLARQRDEIRQRIGTLVTSAVGASALTAAELRLLPWLATHLSFPEIGDRLHVSRHTVKTQAMSIYRKIDASSRSEAVRRATELGLLAG